MGEMSGAALYVRSQRKKGLTLVALLLLLGGVALFSLYLGAFGLHANDLVLTLLGQGPPAAQAVVWNIRLPRICTAAVVGMALALAGCIMQNVLRNPLASSSTLGVSQGAAFGAAIAIVWLNGSLPTVMQPLGQTFTITLCAFAGGLCTTAVILGLARVAQVSAGVMILAGVALGALFSGGTTLVQYFADEIRIATIVYWTFGDLGRTGWGEITLIAVLCLAGLLFFWGQYRQYNGLESGFDTARSLGIRVNRLMLCSMVLAALIAAVSVAFVGTIGFVGLVAPHLARRCTGGNHRFLIPASALMGAIILVTAELASRSLARPGILPIGALTSFLGAPVFLCMIFKFRGNA